MNKLKYCTLFYCLFYYYSQAENYNLIGKVVDSENKPIELGNVILLLVKDSSILRGDFFMQGRFRINGISEKNLLLKITALGFVDYFQPINRNENDSLFDLGTIMLRSNTTLKEVEIISKLPLFERDGEKVKVNVENSALSSAGTVFDILKKSPTVMVNANDNISVFGKGSAVVYVDGQKILSVDLLKTIPSSEIKEIEIISNPSAKYDAAGSAVINILTKKNNLEGYNGNFIHNTLYGKHLFTYTGLRFNYKRKKWSTFLSYGFPHGKTWNSDEYYRNAKSNDSTITEMKNKIFTESNQRNSNYYKGGVTYHIDSTSTIGVQYNGFYSKNNNTINNVNDVLKNKTPQIRIETNTTAKPQMINNTANLNYSKKTDTLQSEITAAVQYGNFISNDLAEINQHIISGNITDEQIKKQTGVNNIQILTGQVDYTKSFNKTWKLESGLKNSFINNESRIDFENFSSAGIWIADPAYINGNKYRENIGAVYAQLRYLKNKTTMRMGVRGEQTNSNGQSKIPGAAKINRDYLNVFPSAFIGYDFTKDINTSITYSSRISRPTFQDLDPFIEYVDSLSSFRGNPDLLPSYTQALEASLIYLKEASLTFSYSRTKGAMNLVVDKLNDGTDAYIATTKNLDFSETYSVGATIPYQLTWWTTYNYFGYMVNTFSYKSSEKIVENTKPMFYMYLYNEFRIKKLFSMEVTFEYTSAGVDGIFTFEPFYNLSANIKKSFFNDKLTCRFIANDILSSAFNKGASKVEGFNVNYISKQRTHYFLIALNYRFGKLKANDYKDKTVNKEEYERIDMEK